MKFLSVSEGFVPDYLLDLSNTNGLVSSTIYRKRDNFHLKIANFLFLGGYGHDVYISQLTRFARVQSMAISSKRKIG